jgi:hypothetical protein
MMHVQVRLAGTWRTRKRSRGVLWVGTRDENNFERGYSCMVEPLLL